MKAAFTTSGENLDAPLDPGFGRALKFMIINLEDDTIEIIDNEHNLNAVQGAGIQSAETISRIGAKILVTGHCGPKAFKALKTAGIKIYNCENATISQALEMFRNGKLVELQDADVSSHW